MLEPSHHYFHKAADVLGLSDNLRTIVLTPMRTVKVDVVTETDEGKLLHHVGFRVQHNNARGPFKGGHHARVRLGVRQAISLRCAPWSVPLADSTRVEANRSALPEDPVDCDSASRGDPTGHHNP